MSMSKNTNIEDVDMRLHLNIWRKLNYVNPDSKIKIVQSRIDQLNAKKVFKIEDLREMIILCDLRRAFCNLENALEQADEYYKIK